MNAKVVGISGLLLVLCLFMVVTTADVWHQPGSSSFLQPNNVENLLRRTALYGILGIGVAFVIITGGIDLSIGSVVCLAGCLLAIFLNVDYRPPDNQPVLEVRASQQQILYEGDAGRFRAGDRIRYFGGRRARPAVLTITEITSQGSAVVLHVDQELTRNDDAGQIARVYVVKAHQRGQPAAQPPLPASVTLAGDHRGLAARDRLTLVHPQSGLNELTISGVAFAGGDTRLTLTGDLGSNFSDQWLALPQLRRQRMPIPLALTLVLAFALGLGLVHGLLVTKLQLQPFVVTLCGLLIYRGLARWLTNDQPVGFKNEYFDTLSPLGDGKLVLWQWESAGRLETFGIPYPFFILVIVAIVAAVFLNKTIWGRYLLALGRNEEAARYSGINTVRITVLAYAISTVLAGLGGILFALYANQVPPSSFGNVFELYAIAAAVLGGCSLRGGEGTIVGVVIGTAVMQVIYNMILLLKISDTLEYAIIGAVILLGVMADELIKRLAARRRAAAQARSSA